jgi:hypothetical protein
LKSKTKIHSQKENKDWSEMRTTRYVKESKRAKSAQLPVCISTSGGTEQNKNRLHTPMAQTPSLHWKEWSQNKDKEKYSQQTESKVGTAKVSSNQKAKWIQKINIKTNSNLQQIKSNE